LPPTRSLATELGVSRSTIVTAYEQLVAEGYLVSTPGSGHTLRPMGVVELKSAPTRKKPDTLESQPRPPMPFLAGMPDMRLFPHQQWAKAVSRLCRANPHAMLVGGTRGGNLALRRAIANHVAEWRGIEASPHQIIVTAGSSDALEICIRTLAKSGDLIALEDPGYRLLHNLTMANGSTPGFLQIDRNGAVLSKAAQEAKLAILTPSHQYPLGGAMSPDRRLEFIGWAKENNSWIIEDDYDSEFRYAGRPIPAMAGFDSLSRTIYVGSFSKIFSNSLRLGYMIVPETLIEAVRTTMHRFGTRASYMPQQVLAEFMNSGEFYRHLRRMRRVYDERRRFLIERLSTDFSQYGIFEDHQAGMQIAFHLREPYIDSKITNEAKAEGLEIEPLSRFCFHAKTANGILLGYCAFTELELAASLSKLQDILERQC